MKLRRGKWLGAAAGVSAATVAGTVVYGRFGTPQSVPLPAAIEGQRRVMNRRAGPVSYYVAGSGRPVLLIHSINAAASAYEVRSLVEALQTDRRVYALDLPGFGFSDRADREYGVALYVSAIHDMVDEIAAEAGASPFDAVALSLSCEFLARADLERPGSFRSLAFVTPTGFGREAIARRGPEGSTREMKGLYAFLRLPLWRRGLYNLLVSRPSLRFFLERTWGSKRIDEGLLDYDYLTAHQPGAENAPYAFVSGRLFAGDIRNVYERLTGPVLVMRGTKGDFKDFSAGDWVRDRSNWSVVSFDTGALCHFERLSEVVGTYRAFLDLPVTDAGASQTSSSGSRSPKP